MTSWEDSYNFAYNSVTKQATVSFCSVKEVWRTEAELKRVGPSAEARVWARAVVLAVHVAFRRVGSVASCSVKINKL